MREEHYKSKLSAFIDRELPVADQQLIGEHLMKCSDCRAEHDRLKLGASLAQTMVRSDAPPALWNSIEDAVDRKASPSVALIPEHPFFGRQGIAAFAVAAGVIAMVVSGAYFILFRAEGETAGYDASVSEQQIESQQHKPSPEVATLPPNKQPEPVIQDPVVIRTESSSVTVSPGSLPAAGASTASFQFETLSGKPKVGSSSTAASLAEGDYLETDGASKARLQVADIGNVEIEPNSRVKLVGSGPKQHRLSLERGVLQAKIYAPPRLFIVDTPSAVAVDLGCAYRLEVDKAGNSYLHVTSGFVALEREGRESIVPAGAKCVTKHGKGLGTPFSAETSEDFRAALDRFDFSNGGSPAVSDMLASRNSYDIITLWHLLSRVGKNDRGRIFDALASYVKPPTGVTKEGILSLKKPMLELWKDEVEQAWFE